MQVLQHHPVENFLACRQTCKIDATREICILQHMGATHADGIAEC